MNADAFSTIGLAPFGRWLALTFRILAFFRNLLIPF
jgi:hypothetical protein